MAQPYEVQGGYDALWQPTPADRIIGADEAKRSTKSYMPDAKFAILLAAIRNHAEGHARAIQELHHDEWHAAGGTNGAARPRCPRGGPCAGLLTFQALADEYPGVRTWFNIHQEVVEHMASHEGFSLRVVAKLAALADEARRQPESSVEVKDPARGH